MSKLFTIWILTFFLVLSLGLIHASRPNVAFTPHSSLHEDVMEMKEELEDENCDGVEGKDECLMRRTLAAHLDYIYTQKHKPRN